MFDTSNIGALQGATVVGPEDEKVGTVGQVFIDPESGRPNWVSVRTGWFGTHETFVPLEHADWDNERLRIPVDKETLKAAPRFDTDAPLSREDEDSLYRFYRYHEGHGDAGQAEAGDRAAAGTDRDGAERPRADAMRDEREASEDRSGTSGAAEGDRGPDEGERREPPGVRDGGRHAAPAAPAGMRLRKYVVTDYQSVTVPVTREEVRLEPEGEPPGSQATGTSPSEDPRHDQ